MEAAIETVFQKYIFFFPECLSVRRTDMFFQGGSICSSNQRRTDMFFKEGLFVRRTDHNYLIEQKLTFPLEHIRIFQEPLLSHQTDINFPGTSIITYIYNGWPRKIYKLLDSL